MSPSATPRTATLTLIAALGGAACDGDAERDRVAAAVRAAEAEVLAAVERDVDSVEAVLAPHPTLASDVRRALRHHLNAAHVGVARQLGVGAVEDSAAVADLLRRGALVRLEDTTRHWIVRDLDHSFATVTPDARAMLIELGQRFHQRLDSLGLPRFRFEITSGLRTTEMQASLRRGNPNAARGLSSHQFGTTVDVAYNTFAPPAGYAPARGAVPPELPGAGRLEARLNERARATLKEQTEERSAELQAILGRVLEQMQSEGRLRSLLERQQPVYHLTVDARHPRPASE